MSTATEMTCPSCHAALRVTVSSAPPPRSTDGAAAVENFMQRLCGDLPAHDLKRMYDEQAREAGWPPLTATMFGRHLRSLGAKAWRTKDDRGWTLPDRLNVTTPDLPQRQT